MKKLYALFTFLLAMVTLLPAQNPTWMVYTASNSGLSNNAVNAVLVDSLNNKWFATDKGISRLTNASWRQETKASSAVSFAVAPSGDLWIGLRSGIAKLSPSKGYSVYSPKQGFPNYRVTAVAVDQNGNVWAATEGGGLVMNPHARMMLYNRDNSGIPSDIVTALEADRNNVIWVGTELAGLASFDGTKWTNYNAMNSALPDNKITAVAVDQMNNKWIGTGNGGLIKFDGASFTVYNKGNSSIPSNAVSAVEVDKVNTVWIGTTDGRAASFNGSAWKVYNSASAGLPGNEIVSIAFDRINGVWFATKGNGAARLCSAPAAKITVSQLSACKGETITLTANNGNYTYQWLINGNPISGATGATYNATATGDYSVLVTDRTACASASQPVHVTIHPLPPAPTISRSGNMLASSTANGNQWYLNGNAIAGATGQFYTPTQEGFYSVQITDATGCAVASAPFAYQYTAIDEKKNEALSAKVYPNPNSGMFNVSISSSDVKIQTLTLSDILGNVVWQENVSDRNNHEIDVDVTGMPPGIYFLNINTTERTFTRKLSIR